MSVILHHLPLFKNVTCLPDDMILILLDGLPSEKTLRSLAGPIVTHHKLVPLQFGGPDKAAKLSWPGTLNI